MQGTILKVGEFLIRHNISFKKKTDEIVCMESDYYMPFNAIMNTIIEHVLTTIFICNEFPVFSQLQISTRLKAAGIIKEGDKLSNFLACLDNIHLHHTW